MLGHANKTPSLSEIEFLRTIGNRSSRYPGTIGPSDYLFLTAFVSILAPQRVIEIGNELGQKSMYFEVRDYDGVQFLKTATAPKALETEPDNLAN